MKYVDLGRVCKVCDKPLKVSTSRSHEQRDKTVVCSNACKKALQRITIYTFHAKNKLK